MINSTDNEQNVLDIASQQKIPGVEPPTDADISKFNAALSTAEQGIPTEIKLWRIRMLELQRNESVKQVGMAEALNKFQAEQTAQRKLATDANTASLTLR